MTLTSDYADLVTVQGMNRRLGEVQADIEGARDAALGAAENVDTLLGQVGEALETTTDARDTILAVLPDAQAAAAAAPHAQAAAALLPEIEGAMAKVQVAASTLTGLTGTAVDSVDPANGVRVTGVQVGPGGGILVQRAAAISEDGLLLTGYTFGGVL